MNRKLAPGKLVIASHNQGKLIEIAALLGPYGMEMVSAGDLDVPEPGSPLVSHQPDSDGRQFAGCPLLGHHNHRDRLQGRAIRAQRRPLRHPCHSRRQCLSRYRGRQWAQLLLRRERYPHAFHLNVS